MFRIVLVHPEIPPNTGNVIRLAATTGCELHLVEPLGFSMEDRLMRRAGLDYHEYADVRVHDSLDAALADRDPARVVAFSSHARVRFDRVDYRPGDVLLFGPESRGLPEEVLARVDESRRLRLPMRPGQRSLNLSNAVAVAVFEAWRQLGYEGAARRRNRDAFVPP